MRLFQTNPSAVRRLTILATLLGASLTVAQAQTWINASSSATSWGLSTNWLHGGIPSSTATIGASLTTHQSITLGGDRRLTSLAIGSGSFYRYTLTGNTLIFGNPITGGSFPATTALYESSGPVTIDSAVKIDLDLTATIRANSVTTINGALSGIKSLTKAGAGTLILTGANTLTRTTSVTGGTLQIGTGGSPHIKFASFGGGSFNIGANATLVIDHSSEQTLTNSISGGGRFIKQGTNKLTLSGNNSYTGGTVLSAGTLELGSANALGQSGTITFSGGSLLFTSSNQTDYSGRFSLADNQAYKIDTGSQTTTFANSLSSVGGSLTKTGSGTLILTAANTYTGATTLSAGTTRVANTSGSAFGTGNVTVASGATLSGNGGFSGALQLNGTLAPGNSPGLLTIGSGSILNGLTLIEIAGVDRGVTYDAINVSGAGLLTFGGTLTVSLLEGWTPVPATFQIFGASTYQGAFSQINLPTVAGYTWGTDSLASNGALSLSAVAASAIPEPSTYAALAGLTTLALAAWRRRRH